MTAVISAVDGLYRAMTGLAGVSAVLRDQVSGEDLARDGSSGDCWPAPAEGVVLVIDSWRATPGSMSQSARDGVWDVRVSVTAHGVESDALSDVGETLLTAAEEADWALVVLESEDPRALTFVFGKPVGC